MSLSISDEMVMEPEDLARYRIELLRGYISSLKQTIRKYEDEIANHEEVLRGDPEPGYEWCTQCNGTGIRGERETCFMCDGDGEIAIS